MWKPTVGEIIGFINRRGIWSESFVEVVFRSHTGKVFSEDMTVRGVIDKKIGDIIFCNGEKCVWYPDEKSAFERLNEVLNELDKKQ